MLCGVISWCGIFCDMFICFCVCVCVCMCVCVCAHAYECARLCIVRVCVGVLQNLVFVGLKDGACICWLNRQWATWVCVITVLPWLGFAKDHPQLQYFSLFFYSNKKLPDNLHSDSETRGLVFKEFANWTRASIFSGTVTMLKEQALSEHTLLQEKHPFSNR